MHIPHQLRCSGSWQDQFIHNHFLQIGFWAWHGYIHHGPGMVACLNIPPAAEYDWDFIPHPKVESYLRGAGAITIDAVLEAIATYDPTSMIVVLLTSNNTININLLQNLKISPAQAHAQVQRRCSEFL